MITRLPTRPIAHPTTGIRRTARLTGQRGLAPATELVIIFPALIVLLGVIVGGSRIWFARSVVTDAAYSGARAASLERTTQQARVAGGKATTQRMEMRGITCLQTTVDLDLDGFRTPIGTPASVTEQIHCRVAIGDVLVPGLPGSMMITGRGSSPIDTYRER
jgi:hypothetical protein